MKRILAIIIIIFVCLFLYGRYIEINNLNSHEITIYNDKFPKTFEDLKIIHISDILYTKNNQKNINKLKNKINKLDADIIVFTGDLLKKGEDYTEDDYNYLKEFMSSLNSSLYKYAIIGDNDKFYLENYKDILYESDFILLDNESTLLFYKDITPINIVGLTDTSKISELMQNEISYSTTIALIHEPDNFKAIADNNIETIFAGHSLGGIINIPYFGGIITKDGAKTYINSNYKYNDSNIYISNGIGNEKIDYRLFNTPSFNIYLIDTQR